MSLFKKIDPKEQMRQQKRVVNKAQRDLGRDKTALERQEKQLELEIKKMAKQGNKQACTVLAKQLVQLRKQKTRNVTTNSRMMGLGHQMQSMQSTAKMAGTMATASKTMGEVNKQVNPQDIQKTLHNLEKESMKMDMSEELMNETLDSVFDGSDDEQEQDSIVNQVLDEIGIDMKSKLPQAPQGTTSLSSKSKEDDELKDLEEQLQKLRS